MALRTRIEPIDRNIALAIRQGESPEERAKSLAGYARKALAEAQEQNRQATGSVPSHETFVDGRRDAPLESVRPNGVIVFEFELVGDALMWIGQMLAKHSPVKSGRFQKSHILFADGIEIAAGAVVPEASEYIFLNVQPYARKIERGLSKQAPDGVFQVVAALASRRFGNIASIKFSYRSFQGGGVVDYIATGSNRNRNRSARSGRFESTPSANATRRARERATRQPCIVVAMR